MEMHYLKQVLANSSYIVVLLGIRASMDCGCLNYRQEDGLYELEKRYGLSPEEILSAGFYNSRPGKFFEFYKNEVLGNLGEPDECMKTLAFLEKNGRVRAVITRELYSLAKRAGCENVIELHGSVYDNKCPRCQKEYPVEYMKAAHGVPLCKDCGIPVRPQICLMGEMVDSRRICRAAEEMEKADTLLILGTHFESILVRTCLPYFNGKEIILVNEDKHLSDRKASCVYHERPVDFLPEAVKAMADTW